MTYFSTTANNNASIIITIIACTFLSTPIAPLIDNREDIFYLIDYIFLLFIITHPMLIKKLKMNLALINQSDQLK